MSGADHHHDHHDHAEIDASGRPGYYDMLETAVRELLVEKKLIGPDEIRRQIEWTSNFHFMGFIFLNWHHFLPAVFPLDQKALCLSPRTATHDKGSPRFSLRHFIRSTNFPKPLFRLPRMTLALILPLKNTSFALLSSNGFSAGHAGCK